MRFSFREVSSINSIPVYKSWSQKGYKPISVQGTDSNSTFSCTFNLVSSVNSSCTSKKRRILIREVTTSVSFSRSYKPYSLLANSEFRYKFLSAVCKLQQLLCSIYCIGSDSSYFIEMGLLFSWILFPRISVSVRVFIICLNILLNTQINSSI